MTLPPSGLHADARLEDLKDDATAARTTTPLDGVPVPVMLQPAVLEPAVLPPPPGRMQVSYSTSPPPPLWPAGETKVVELIEKTPEARSQFEQEREREGKLRASSSSSSRIPGLSAFQQRVAMVADEAAKDSASGEDAVRLRRGPSSDSQPQQPPSLPAGQGFGPAKEKEAPRNLDEEAGAVSLTASEGETFSGAPDSLEPSCIQKATPVPAPSAAPAPVLPAAHQQQQEATPRPRAPSSEALSASTSSAPRQAIGAKGKSSSIESLASPPPPPLLPKAASSDSITGMHQVTIPLGSAGVSITQRVAEPVALPALAAAAAACAATPTALTSSTEEPHCVTVACVSHPASAPATSTPATPTPASTQPPRSGAPAVTLVNLPSPAASSLTASSADSRADSPTDADGPVEADKAADKLGDRPADEPADRTADGPEKTDKTEKWDLPAERNSGERLAALLRPTVPTVPTLQALQRKSLPPMPLAADRVEQPAGAKAKVPEFMRVQLNRVDSKPAVNVVLSTATSPERGSRGSIGSLDPWAVEEVMVEASLPASLLGLRSKRSASKDDLAGSPPTSPLSASPPKVRSVATVPPRPCNPAAVLQPQALGRKPQTQPPPAKRPLCLSEDNNNVIIVEKKDLKKAGEQGPEDAAPAGVGRRTASRDSLQSSTEEKDKSRDSSVSPVLDGVVLRRKSLPREALGQDKARDDTPELMKVFARRSLKVRDSEGELSLPPLPTPLPRDSSVPVVEPPQASPPQQRANRDSDKENESSESPSTSPKSSPKTSPKEERAVTVAAGARFQRSVPQPSQEQPPRPAPLGEKPTKPAKPAAALELIIKDNNSNRLRVRKPDNALSNGGAANNNNHNNNNNILNNGAEKTEKTVAAVAPSSVVAKMSARWTLPAETKPPAGVPVVASTPAVVAAEAEADVAAEDANSAVPKFKRIQQRREEWEQRAKQSKSLQRAAQ
ncbi:proline-rich protein 36-like [Thrips palmi]|uniref:Proline-rich protein 36-like n=1 Tax=Thrips palmi TaxID=161013 RepID=A0A6P8ZZI1_THRPL|nr:proline-rich protein 36-like [Thrips palmi]